MPVLCAECFNDPELVAFVKTQGNVGECSICEAVDVPIISVDELNDFFLNLFNQFEPAVSGLSLVDFLQTHWNFFSSSKNGEKIVQTYRRSVGSGLAYSTDHVAVSNVIAENVGYWEKLKNELMFERRYIADIDRLTDDYGWDGLFSRQFGLLNDKDFYRARLHSESDYPAFLATEMFCPPHAVATAGRANPEGIPYLYLSDNPSTVLYEIRAGYLDEVSIGVFRVKKGLTRPISIADFTDAPPLYSTSSIEDIITETLLKKAISQDLSKPMRRYDSEREYIPTQFICEFIKVFAGVDGIQFASSLDPSGKNLVLFDQDLMDCTGVSKVKVSKVEISV